MKPRKNWTEKEIDIISNNRNMFMKELMELLPGRSKTIIYRKIKELGLTLPRQKHILNSDQIEIFKDIYPKMENKEIEKILPITEAQIYSLARALKVKKDLTQRKSTYVRKKEYSYYYYKKYSIIIEEENLELIDVIQWYEYLFETPNGKYMGQLPSYIYKDENNLIKIWRYVFEKKLECKTREDLIQFSTEQLIPYKIFFRNNKTNKPYQLFEIINLTYPDYKIYEWELPCVQNNFFKSEEVCIKAIDWLLEKYNFTLNDILNNKLTQGIIYKEKFVTIWFKFHNIYDLLIWYYKIKYNVDITYSDFKVKPKRYMHDKDNADYELKKFVKSLFDEDILNDKNFRYELQNIFNEEYICDIGQYQLITAVYYHYKTITFYQWLNDVYPEWELKPEDFKINITFDNKKVDSRWEASVYNFIKNNYNIDLKIVGRNKKHKFYNEKEDEYYLPDFYISKIDNIKLDKILYVELFGMYNKNPHNEIYQDYKNKTHRKENFYRSNPDIYFISLYPDDLKNNFLGLKQKFEPFFMQNFNITLPLPI